MYGLTHFLFSLPTRFKGLLLIICHFSANCYGYAHSEELTVALSLCLLMCFRLRNEQVSSRQTREPTLLLSENVGRRRAHIGDHKCWKILDDSHWHIGESSDTHKHTLETQVVCSLHLRKMNFCLFVTIQIGWQQTKKKCGTKWRQIVINAWNLPEKCFCHVPHACRGNTP